MYAFVISQGLGWKMKPKPVIRTPYKPEASCEVLESAGKRTAPCFLLSLLIVLMCLAAFDA